MRFPLHAVGSLVFSRRSAQARKGINQVGTTGMKVMMN